MKTTTQARDPEAFEKLREIVRDIDIAMITTVTPDGALHSRPMVTRDFGDDGELWFFTSDDDDMAHDVESEHAVNVSYADPKSRRYVSITGNASLLRDSDKAHELWADTLKPYFPRGLDEPHLALLRVRIESAEFWESPASKSLHIFRQLRGKAAAGGGEDRHTKIGVRATPASG